MPHDVADESTLDPRLASWLAFADQKVAQVVTLARGLVDGRAAIADALAEASAALADRRSAPGVRDGAVRERASALGADDFARGDYDDRVAAQEAELALPVLPTTTIGSFPQTGDIRRARARHGRGELSADEYESFLRDEIAQVVTLQEDIGLDVLVHGEAERNDMVQYFAENLDGFAVTENGWVQSYGSRATRPSILWGDVARPAAITVAWSTFAQSLTDKPMKGMLTGPVTILAWSFVRDDQPLGETANQVALALRDEIAELEEAGIRVIQVDEPALRELLPLKRADQPAYLEWSVGSFRLATAGAAPATQVHTHLCYSEFDVVIDAIAALDADVTSIEAARSRGEVIGDIATSGFAAGIGPGVYDIHSPRVPSVDEITELLDRTVAELPLRRVWVNPDCGLKTRGYDETVASLKNLVAATQAVRGGACRPRSRFFESGCRGRVGRGIRLDHEGVGIRVARAGVDDHDGVGFGRVAVPDGYAAVEQVRVADCGHLLGAPLQQFEDPGDAECDDSHEHDVADRQRPQQEEPDHREHGDEGPHQDALPAEPQPERIGVESSRGQFTPPRRIHAVDGAAQAACRRRPAGHPAQNRDEDTEERDDERGLLHVADQLFVDDVQRVGREAEHPRRDAHGGIADREHDGQGHAAEGESDARPEDGGATAAGDQDAEAEQRDRDDRQPEPERVRGGVTGADRREVVAFAEDDDAIDGGDQLSGTQAPIDEVLLHALDDRAQLDPHALVGADDESAAVGGGHAHQGAMGGARRGGPHFSEGIGLDHSSDRRRHEALEAVGSRRLQELEGVGGAGRQSEAGDAVEDVRGDLVEVDLGVDRLHGLVDDHRLHRGIVHQRRQRSDEGVLVGQLYTGPRADDRHRDEDGGDGDAQGREQRTPPSTASA